MPDLTVDALKAIMSRCVTDDDAIDLDTDFLDTPFSHLGYPSLALLETAAIVRREYGVVLAADDDLHAIGTPRALLTGANLELATR